MVRLRLKGQPAQRIAVFSSTSRLWQAPRPEAHRLVAPSREPLRRSCSTITAASCGLTPASWAARVRVAPRARAWVRRWRGPVASVLGATPAMPVLGATAPVAPALGALVLVLGPTAPVAPLLPGPELSPRPAVLLAAATATPSPGFCCGPPAQPAGPTTPAATSSTPFARRRRGHPSATRADFTKSVARSGTPPPPRSRPSPAARPQR